MTAYRVVIAPDSFKGSMSAVDAAQAIADGWLESRPDDQVLVFPMADGGEGTLEIVRNATPGSRVVDVGLVTGPDGTPTPSHYLALDDQTALVELAVCSGITLMNPLNAMGATTVGLGETIRAALDNGIHHVIIALGGSASTDAGIGALQALGLRATTADGGEAGVGGAFLGNLVAYDTSKLRVPDKVTILRDTTATFLNAPGMFGPQKGATPDDVTRLERSFRHLLQLTGDTTNYLIPGAGAAGGCGWGFAHFLGATIIDGAQTVADLIGATEAISHADAVITGEGKFDSTSVTGKVTGAIITLARRKKIPIGVVAGVVDADSTATISWSSLVDQAGDVNAAMSSPQLFARKASTTLVTSMFP
jgi:glycerate 2-kinase